MDLSGLGRVLLVVAGFIAVVAVIMLVLGRLGVPRLPGDLSFGRGNTRVFVPLGTSILISIVLTILLNLFLRR